MNITIIKTLVFFTIYIFLLGIPLAYSQNNDYFETKLNVFALAEEYFQQKDYANAVLEYERVFFFVSEAELQKQALKKKAHSYKKDKKYLLSAQTLQRIPLYLMTIEEKDSIYYEMLLCSYLEDDFDFASKIMNNMNLEVKENPSKRLLLMQILLSNELNEYNSAYDYLLQYIEKEPVLRGEDKYVLDSLYNNLPKHKSENKAKHLAFFPGLGHIYSGYWFEGICAFVVNAGVLWFGVSEFLLKDYITAWVGGAGLLSSTYLGQQKRAVHLAKKHNYLANKEFNTQIKQILLNNL
ncbi:MAG: hypothetical protein Q4Q06_07240 [Bacteroidota bacterium]|nr:hypothetical protein [Bacteroidota bacterium]